MKKINITENIAADMVLVDISQMPEAHNELKEWVIQKSKEKIFD